MNDHARCPCIEDILMYWKTVLYFAIVTPRSSAEGHRCQLPVSEHETAKLDNWQSPRQLSDARANCPKLATIGDVREQYQVPTDQCGHLAINEASKSKGGTEGGFPGETDSLGLIILFLRRCQNGT